MLQVYDRALTSGSVQTLVALSVLAIGLYLFQGCFDVIRSQVLVRVGARLDKAIAPIAHRVAIDMPRFGFSTSEALERGRDVDTVRGFLGSQAPVALFDLPWIPLYLAFVYFLHPWLGALTLGGAVVLTFLTIASELLTRGLSGTSAPRRRSARNHRRFQCPQRRGAEGDGLCRPRGGALHAGQSRASDPADAEQRSRRHVGSGLSRCCAWCCNRRRWGSPPISPSRASSRPARSSPPRSPRRGRWPRSTWRSATGRAFVAARRALPG